MNPFHRTNRTSETNQLIMKLTRRALLNPALTRGLLVAGLLMTTLASHSAPITDEEAHTIGLDLYL